MLTPDGILVRAGSLSRKQFIESAKNLPFTRKRDKLVEDGILREKGKSYEFTEDFEFKSPSGAASILLARMANGWIEWKNAQGKTLKEVKREGQMKNELIFYRTPAGEKRIEVVYRDETFWMSQRGLAELFSVKTPAISKHLKNIFESGELTAEARSLHWRRS